MWRTDRRTDGQTDIMPMHNYVAYFVRCCCTAGPCRRHSECSPQAPMWRRHHRVLPVVCPRSASATSSLPAAFPSPSQDPSTTLCSSCLTSSTLVCSTSVVVAKPLLRRRWDKNKCKLYYSWYWFLDKVNVAMHSQPRSALRCTLVPPGEFNNIIATELSIDWKFRNKTSNRFAVCCTGLQRTLQQCNKHVQPKKVTKINNVEWTQWQI